MGYIQYFSHNKDISNNLLSSSKVHTNTDQETLAVWLLQKLKWKKKNNICFLFHSKYLMYSNKVCITRFSKIQSNIITSRHSVVHTTSVLWRCFILYNQILLHTDSKYHHLALQHFPHNLQGTVLAELKFSRWLI